MFDIAGKTVLICILVSVRFAFCLCSPRCCWP